MQVFAKIIATMTLIAKVCYFKIICDSIFKHFLAVDSKNLSFFGSISISFVMVKTNTQKKLDLYYFV